jgi:hypothetical protein
MDVGVIEDRGWGIVDSIPPGVPVSLLIASSLQGTISIAMRQSVQIFLVIRII